MKGAMERFVSFIQHFTFKMSGRDFRYDLIYSLVPSLKSSLENVAKSEKLAAQNAVTKFSHFPNLHTGRAAKALSCKDARKARKPT